MYLGDFVAGSTINFKWNTISLSSGSITRATNGNIRIYKNDSAVQRTSASGITDTEDFDTLTGVHHCKIDLSDNTDAGFYAAGNDYQVVIEGAVIDGLTINAVLAEFSIENRNDKADVREFGGSAGTFSGGRPEVNTSHVGGTLQTAGDIIGDTNDIQSRLPAALVSGRIDASVGAMAANTLTAAATAADVVTEFQAGLSTLDAAGVRAAVGLAAANLDTQLTAIDDFLDTEIAAIKAKTDNLPANPAAVSDIPTAAAIADAVHDEQVDGTLSWRQSVRLQNAALFGKMSGGGTTTVTFRNPGDTINRLVAVVDANGNRSTVTRDVS